LTAAKSKRRVFCRPCLDWTERRPHIGGAVRAALARRCFDLKWIERVRDTRALAITPTGRRGLLEHFHLSVGGGRARPRLFDRHRTGRGRISDSGAKRSDCLVVAPPYH